MLSAEKISEISNKINEVIKSSPLADIEKNVNALIRGAFTKMELVSREEFDVQAQVLQNTRDKLVQLEQKLAQLEKQTTQLEK